MPAVLELLRISRRPIPEITMSQRSCLSIILAAGEGTRMKSAKSKVLHEIAGLPMVAHVAAAASRAGGAELALVVGHGADEVRKAAAKFAPDAEIFVQDRRLGTGHAVLSARSAIERGYDDILVMFGDTPLIEAEALSCRAKSWPKALPSWSSGFERRKPAGYGRLIEAGGKLLAIREDKDASEQERKIEFCNGGLMAIAGKHALRLLDQVGNANAKGEYYLTDIVEIAAKAGLDVVGDRGQRRKRARHQQPRRARRGGSHLAATPPPRHDAGWRHADCARNGLFLARHRNRSRNHHRAECLFRAGREGRVGRENPCLLPYRGCDDCGQLRCRAVRAAAAGRGSAREGQGRNFCEVKKATIEAGAKVNHLTYIGDARVGAGANIGAGTITCNYDGYGKFFTDIGAGAFIGSNSSLVAPISIGNGAYVASGSTITENVPDDALAFGRARQNTMPGKGA